MSYEIIFNYHEKTEKGYDREVEKELKKKIGKPYEDISIDKLASYILTQLARRDIFIFDYEVFEYKKQRLNCKETKDGLIIKGKKYAFDGSLIEEISGLEYNEDNNININYPHNKVVAQPKVLQKSIQNIDTLKSNRKVLMYVTPDPEIGLFDKLTKVLGFKFSKDKKYPVYEQKAGSMIGLYKYLLLDDNNKYVNCSSEFFVASKFIYDKDDANDSFDSNEVNLNKKIKLGFEDEFIDDIVDIRKIR